MEDAVKWYVITTKSRAEKKVSLGLAKMGITHFLPMQKQLRLWKDRKKWVEMILFPSYVFVHIAESNKNELFGLPGIVRFLSIEGRLSELRNEEIERIRQICAYQSPVSISNETMLLGDEVEVVEGILKGIKGRVTDKANSTYLYVQIENLGFTASFKIEKHLLKKL